MTIRTWFGLNSSKLPALVGAAFMALGLAACGAGGGSSSGSGVITPTAAPTIQVLPATFDFGRVTTGNTAAPLEVTVRNTGSAPLRVVAINLLPGSSGSFVLNFTAGTRPCGTQAPTVAAGDSCTFRVTFQPSGNGSFTGNVQIASNDTATPLVGVPVAGTSEAITSIAVRVNQVDTSCPSNASTAYVSVVDQGGFSLADLTTGNFTLTEGTATNNLLLSATRVDAAYKPIAIAAVVDNSASVTTQPVTFSNVKNGFATLFNNLKGNDVGELIDFGSAFRVTVPFPSPSSTSNATNQSALIAGLAVPWTGDANTLLYDSVFKAIDDTAVQTAYRRAVIVATDGVDEGLTPGVQLSTHSLSDVVANAVAKKVPVFTIGIGNSINATVLQSMATQTGGMFYQASTSQNLAAIYQQLSTLLFQNQYLLTFNQRSVGTAGTSSPLSVNVTTSNGIQGSGAGSVTSCN